MHFLSWLFINSRGDFTLRKPRMEVLQLMMLSGKFMKFETTTTEKTATQIISAGAKSLGVLFKNST